LLTPSSKDDIGKSIEEKHLAVQKKEAGCMGRWRGKGSAGYLNLLGSFIHNFVDGLSIGLVFAIGNR
jgi:zinc transporter ZupT